MADLSKVLGGPWTPPTEKRVTPPEEQLIDAMRGAGLEPPEQIHLDGKLHTSSQAPRGRARAEISRDGMLSMVTAFLPGALGAGALA